LGTDTLDSVEEAYLCGGPRDNILDASGFTGSLVILEGQGGNDTLIGHTVGNDRVRAQGDADFTLTNSQLTGLGTDTLTDIEEAELIGYSGDNTFDASAFTLGSVSLSGGGGNDTLLGGSYGDRLTGGFGDDLLTGGAGADTLTGNAGSDRFVLSSLADSVLAGFDVIRDLAISKDSLDGPNTVSAANIAHLGSVDSLTLTELQALLTDQAFIANGAATFTDSAGRTFLALNDGTDGYSAADAIIEISGFSGNLTALAIV
jgi:hypothetical protein